MKRYSGLFITGEGNELTHYIGGADNDKPADSDADHTTGYRDEIVTGVRLLRGNIGRDNTTIDVSHVRGTRPACTAAPLQHHENHTMFLPLIPLCFLIQ
jgi:hypothetical protein